MGGLEQFNFKEGDSFLDMKFKEFKQTISNLEKEIINGYKLKELNRKIPKYDKENCITKTPYFDREGVIVFDMKDNSGINWQIVTKKQQGKFVVRVKKNIDGKRYTQKNNGNDLSIIESNDKNSFNIKMGAVLDSVIGADKRGKIPTTGGIVFDALNIKIETKNTNKKKGSQPVPVTGQRKVESKSTNHESKEKKSGRTNLKKKPLELEYHETQKEKKVQINLPKNHFTVEGRITRCMRWSSITDAVEDRYGIPRGLLLAMMAQEGWGDPTVINQGKYAVRVGKGKGTHIKYIDNGKKKYKDVGKGKGDYVIHECDGGAGLIHVQAANAADYGLKTLPRSTRKMRDLAHGDKLLQLKSKYGNDLKRMCEADDRFNPVLAVDLAARFLRANYNPNNGKDAWLIAAKKYAGRGDDYYYPVVVYWTTINSVRNKPMPTFTKQIERIKSGKGSALVNGVSENVNSCIARTKDAMKNLNPRLDGKSVTYSEYQKYMEGSCNNYGLDKYKNYDREHPYLRK